MWRRRRSRSNGSAAPDLTAECEAFLSGGYTRYLEDRGAPIPVWAWTNLLAHATEQEIRSMVSASGPRARASARWRDACSYVAGEVLDLAERRGSLCELQATVLMPLELELMSRREAASWAPGQWVAAVMAILHEHGHRRPRP
jgi:hypothetical protein